MQKILSSRDNYYELEEYLKTESYGKIFVVCSHSFYKGNVYKKLNDLDLDIVYFDEFLPNPTYESVCLGLEEFKKNNCDSIIAVGGGSAIDVAKCIKLFANMNEDDLYLNQKIVPNDIKLMAIPTTAGTGSEATHFAVIYYQGEKKSISDYSSIPETVLFDESSLKTLPLYQKKATIMDAYSHAIESLWSVNSTDESKEYSCEAISVIRDNIDSYLENDIDTFEEVLKASNLAGKAINISKTTAGHAMCYKLTSLYNIAHGHAAMLVNSELLPYMMDNIDKCSDKRGASYLEDIFKYLSSLLNISYSELGDYFRGLLIKYDLYDVSVNEDDIDILVNSVNVERLSNNPVKLDNDDIKKIYTKTFNRIKEVRNASN